MPTKKSTKKPVKKRTVTKTKKTAGPKKKAVVKAKALPFSILRPGLDGAFEYVKTHKLKVIPRVGELIFLSTDVYDVTKIQHNMFSGNVTVVAMPVEKTVSHPTEVVERKTFQAPEGDGTELDGEPDFSDDEDEDEDDGLDEEETQPSALN